MLLTGTYQRSLDEKHRFAIPKRLRDALGHPNNSVMYMAPGTDGSLALYTEEGFARMGEQLSQGSPTELDVRTFSRLFYAQAQLIEIDRVGRVRVPAELAQFARLDKEIVLLGVRDHLEIWDKQRWDSYLVEKGSHYDEIAENAFGRRAGQGAGQGEEQASPTPAESARPAQPR